jgi:transposase
MGLSFKKTKHVPGGMPERSVQEDFAKKIIIAVEEARASKEKHIVLSADPTHPIHNSIPGYRWQEKGKKKTQTLPANTGRRRVTVVGAVNLVNQDMVPFITESNADVALMAVFLLEVKKKYSKAEKITIILDNAAYQKSYETQEHARSLNIDLLYLPPYTPNLSLIERVWKFFKKKVLRNHYYATFNEFFGAICEFFVKWDEYADEMRRLLTLKFEIMGK